MDQTSKEATLYLMRFIEQYIEESICNVLEDSQEDPEHSAVTTANVIMCYIEAMKTLDIALPYTDVKGYFLHNNFSQQDWEKFESSRQKESVYYTGKQWETGHR